MKKNKTTFKPDIVVDLTNAKSAADVYEAFANAKINKYFTTDEKNILAESLTIVCVEVEKKPSLLKRFWNWITRKK